ncbi:MAG: phosphate ABC transporter permease family protein, partial [Pseudomonadota bacterium]|nr:phosphate ABC transporter permease family protein [Pseudomonadota bacterium]
MPLPWLVLIVLALAGAGYVLGRQRAMSSAGGNTRHLHSLPVYYGSNVAIFAAVPAMLLLAIWLIVQPIVVNSIVSAEIPQSAIPEGSTLGLVMSDVRRVADGLDIAVAQGTMTVDEAHDVRAGFTDVRERLAEVGVALGSNVDAPTLYAA